jgi:hypothetical protein
VVAITVTVVAEAMLLGALYPPFDTDPTAGTNDQETLELLFPLTLNCTDCPAVAEAEAGDI